MRRDRLDAKSTQACPSGRRHWARGPGPRGWDDIPGARGCSQEACSFRDNLAALQQHGAQQVLALSSDDAQYQQDLARRLHLPYAMLSDLEPVIRRHPGGPGL